MTRPDWTYGLRYRTVARLLHRFDLHHTRRSVLPDGRIGHRCTWCGVSRTETPMWMTERLMREARASKRGGSVDG
jgi:hypothetical protein